MSNQAFGKEMGGNTRTAVTPQPDEGAWRLEEQDGELLPGVPNEITFHHIIPNLPWRAFHVLSSVNRCWKKLIQSGQVYETRVRGHLTETLIAFIDTVKGGVYSITLYSSRDKSWYRLPPIPDTRTIIPIGCQCVSVDGKIYVMRDCYVIKVDPAGKKTKVSLTEVYSLDLVRQTGWKQCATMPEPRTGFECGVMDGKIHVFGGHAFTANSYVPAGTYCVYDPKENAWTSMKLMKSIPDSFHIVAVGEDLVLYGQRVDAYDYVDDDEFGRARGGSFLEIYHPGKDDWTVVDPYILFKNPSFWWTELLFTVQGKVHAIGSNHISAFDIGNGASTHLDSFLRPNDYPNNLHLYGRIQICAIQAVDHELLALAKSYLASDSREVHYTLFQSKGFGSEEKQIFWERVDSPVSFLFHITYSSDNICASTCRSREEPAFPSKRLAFKHFMCPIQL